MTLCVAVARVIVGTRAAAEAGVVGTALAVALLILFAWDPVSSPRPGRHGPTAEEGSRPAARTASA